VLQAGAATEEITPNRPMPLFGYPHVERVSTGVHDPILASALCVSNQKESVLLLSLDLLFLDPPTAKDLRRTVSKAVGMKEQNVFISCTHTHSAPVTVSLLSWSRDPAVPPPDCSYIEYVKKRAVIAAQRALDERKPAQLAWTTARADGAGGNRLTDGGTTDPEVGILSLKHAERDLFLAVLLIYGMHPTVLHEDSKLISSDFPHYVRHTVRNALDGHPLVLYHTGPSGNQSPRRFIQGQTFREADRMGQKVGYAALLAISNLSPDAFQSNATLQGAIREVDLPIRQQPSMKEAESTLRERRAEYERLQLCGAPRERVRTAECAVFGAEGAVRLAEANESGELQALLYDYSPAQVQVLRIGDTFLAGLPGELFSEYGLRIKEDASNRAFPVCLVNGELQGYIVTSEASSEGGYESANSVFDPSAGNILVKAVLDLIEGMGGKT